MKLLTLFSLIFLIGCAGRPCKTETVMKYEYDPTTRMFKLVPVQLCVEPQALTNVDCKQQQTPFWVR